MHDLGTAFRQLIRRPGFALLTAVTLALGVGVNSVMFSLTDAVVFRPLPMRDPSRLVRIAMTDAKQSGLGGVSYPLMKELARESKTLEGLVGEGGSGYVHLSIGDAPAERAMGYGVAGNFFSVLGVKAALGRVLTEDDDRRAGEHPVLVLSDTFWRSRLGADPHVVGKTVRLNTSVFTVVGVTPPGFFGTSLDPLPELWFPLTMSVVATPNIEQFKPFERRGFTWVELVGRMREGVTPEAVAAELGTLNDRIARDLKIDAAGDRYDRFRVTPLSETIATGDRDLRPLSRMLLGVAALLLLIAGTVTGGLLLVRGEQRHREIAVRMTVGASRARLVRQLLAEAAILSVAASLIAVVLARWSLTLLQATLGATSPLPLGAASPVFEPRVVAFTAIVSFVCSAAFALLPALRVSRPNLVEAIKRDASLSARGSARVSLRDGFVVAQVALSVIVLVGAGLLLRSLHAASGIDLGFDPGKAVMVSLDVSKSGYNRARGIEFYDRLLERVRALPGVESAAISRHIPVQDPGMITSLQLTNFTPPGGEEPRVSFTPVSPGFFRALGLPLVAGRDFDPTDAPERAMLIVNQAFADRFWRGRDPLREKVLNFGKGGAEIVGVVANAKQSSLRTSNEPMVYVPATLFYMPSTSVIVRGSGDPRATLGSVGAVVRLLDRAIPIVRSRTLREHVGASLDHERAIAALLSAFALLALLLTGLGLYGAVAYVTQLRRREFGIRLSLGALPSRLLGSVLGHGAVLAATGVIVGAFGALAASRALSTLLIGVTPADPVTFLASAALMFILALAAALVPARMAARVDPAITLRSE